MNSEIIIGLVIGSILGFPFLLIGIGMWKDIFSNLNKGSKDV